MVLGRCKSQWLAAFTRVRKTGPFIGFIENLVLRTLRRHSSALTASSLAPSVAAASATSGRLPALDHTATRAALLPSPAPPTLVAAASIAITVAPTTGGVASLVAVLLLLPSCCSPRLPRCRLCRQRRAAIAVALASCPPPLSHSLRCHLLQLGCLSSASCISTSFGVVFATGLQLHSIHLPTFAVTAVVIATLGVACLLCYCVRTVQV